MDLFEQITDVTRPVVKKMAQGKFIYYVRINYKYYQTTDEDAAKKFSYMFGGEIWCEPWSGGNVELQVG